MNSKNNKSSESHKVALNLGDKIALKWGDKYLSFQMLVSTIDEKI